MTVRARHGFPTDNDENHIMTDRTDDDAIAERVNAAREDAVDEHGRGEARALFLGPNLGLERW